MHQKTQKVEIPFHPQSKISLVRERDVEIKENCGQPPFIETSPPQVEILTTKDLLDQNFAENSKQNTQVSPDCDKEEFIQMIGYPNFTKNEDFWSNLFYLNYYKLTHHLHKTVYSKQKPLSIMDLPLLSKDEQINASLERLQKKLSLYKELNKMVILKSLVSIFKRDLVVLIVSNLVFVALICLSSLVVKFLIDAVIANKKGDAFMWMGVLMGVLVLRALIQRSTSDLSTKLRLMLISLLYSKLEKISCFNAQKANLGKIINIISGDMNTLENDLLFFLPFFCTPLKITFIIIIFSFTFDIFSSFSGILPSILILFFSALLQKYNGSFYVKRNQFTDERIKRTKETIENIRLIKMYGWEKAFKDSVDTMRENEMKQILKIHSNNYMMRTIFFSSPYILGFIMFIVYHTQGGELQAALIYFAILLLDFFRVYVIQMFGVGFQLVFEIKVIFQRILDVLMIEDQSTDPSFVKAHQILSDQDKIMQFNNYNAYWSKEDFMNEKPILRELNGVFLADKNYGVIGKIGSGKSSFLLALLHEIPYFKGSFLRRPSASLAYVGPDAFIFAGTIRSNILFGRPLNLDFYKEVIYACALHKDLLEFEKGDLTEVGEKGITLSGGQRTRVNLARALYSEADVFLLDDPLSAIEAKVVSHVYEKAIKEKMKGKCVFLVTHQIQFLDAVDEVILLEEGSVQKRGAPSLFQGELKDVLSSDEKKVEAFSNLATSSESELDKIKIEIDKEQLKFFAETNNSNNEKLIHRKTIQNFDFSKLLGEGKKFIKDESNEMSRKTLATMGQYFTQLRSPLIIFLVIAFFVSSELTRLGIARIFGLGSVMDPDYIFIYTGILIVVYVILSIAKFNLCNYMILKANTNIHVRMLHRLIRTSIVYFDTNPTGRIINRFSHDMSFMDNVLHFILSEVIDVGFFSITMLVAILVLNPFLIIFMAFLFLIYYFIMKYFYEIFADIKRLDSASKSPITTFFLTTVQGLLSIKVYKKNAFFQQKFFNLIHSYARSNYIIYRMLIAFGFIVEITAIPFTCVSISFLILFVHDSSLFGLCLIFLLTILDTIQWFLRLILLLITTFSSVDRTLTYAKLPSEGHLRKKNEKLSDHHKHHHEWDAHFFSPGGRTKYEEIPLETISQEHLTDWPQNGQIIFNKVFMRYREDTPLVLKDLSFTIAPGEKVGCVGRAGAGKSSLTQVLFRMVKMEKEKESFLKIDGVDIRSVGLHTLRHKISIIPQVPFVFSGSIRLNLDPLSEYSEEDLWKVLAEVDLKRNIESLAKKLSTDMTECDSVFSSGQKQLFCLARALLKNNKILVFDEATSNLDAETDKFIQKKLKEKFDNCTIITIAHRILTIADYDKVLVMDEGTCVEFDEPFKLLAKSEEDTEITQSSYFAELVKNSGEAISKSIFELAKNRFLSKK